MTDTHTTSLDPMFSVSTPFSFIFGLKHWENMSNPVLFSIVILTNCSHRPCCSTIWIWVGPVGRGAAYQIPLKRAFNTLTCPIPSHPNQIQLHNTFWYSLAQFPRRLVKKKSGYFTIRLTVSPHPPTKRSNSGIAEALKAFEMHFLDHSQWDKNVFWVS